MGHINIGSRNISTQLNTLIVGKSDVNHIHSKNEVGLSEVDNTSDLNKPISNATNNKIESEISILKKLILKFI